MRIDWDNDSFGTGEWEQNFGTDGDMTYATLHDASFVEIVLSSKWTRVSLKGSRQNWQETVPGEEKVNQLLNTNCNKWHINRFMKDVQKSIIQLYLEKVTL